MLEPLPVQSPFAAGRNQLVADQRLQDVQPVRPFARGRQRRKPELVQSQLIPQKSGHPAGTPLTRPTQSHLAQSNRHHIAIERRGSTILGKQRNLFGLSSAFIEDLDPLAPRRFLAVVDLSKIQHLPLNHAAVMSAPVLHNGPCPMFLAVLATNLGAQKHDADSRLACARARSLVGTTGVLANLSSAKSSACRREGTNWLNILKTLVGYQLISPGSEWRLHRHWFEHSAMGDLLGEDLGLGHTNNTYS